MDSEYQRRRSKAEEINEKIGDLVEGLLIVGSVAYNPKAVTSKSDLDLVGILNFSEVDFHKLYKRLDQEYEPLLVKHAKEGSINNVSIVWDTPQFEVGLHLWDTSAFERVVNLQGYNYIFRRTDFGRNFKSTADGETLKNLKGEEKEIFKDPKEIEGGHVLKFYSYFEDGSNVYPGIQMFNLLLDPIILTQKDNIISQGMNAFKNNLIEKLSRCYQKSSSEISLYHALHPKLQGKITNDLKKRLDAFF